MRLSTAGVAAALLLTVPGSALLAQPDVLGKIRDEGLNRSKVQSYFSALTDDIGPRLTGSPAYKRAAEWARDQMVRDGFADAKLEPWEFGRGWVLDKLVVEIPRYTINYAKEKG